MTLRIYEWQLEVEPLELVGEEVRPFVERLVDDVHAAGFAVKGKNLFYDQMPDRAETPCLVIRDMGGEPDRGGNPFGKEMVLFQARGGNWEEAREFCATVFNHFHGATGKSVTGYRILSCLAEGFPASM